MNVQDVHGQDMIRRDQINLLKRLLHYVDTRTTSMADAPWCNEVAAYTDPERLAKEQSILFRQHPILMGFASEWSAPGSFRTDDFVGNGVLIAYLAHFGADSIRATKTLFVRFQLFRARIGASLHRFIVPTFKSGTIISPPHLHHVP